MLFIYSDKINFGFLIYNDAYFEYSQHYKKRTVRELKYFLFENYYRQIGFTKEKCDYSMKHLKKKDLLLPATKLIKNT